MFAYPYHIPNDGDFVDDGDDEFIESEEGIIDVGDILITNENEFTMNNVGRSNGNPRSYAPMEKALAHLGFTMQKIVKKYKQGGVPLCDHATSHMKVLTLDI